MRKAATRSSPSRTRTAKLDPTGDGKTRRRASKLQNSRVPLSPHPAVITLLTDFGLRDHFVASMKGVILSINPLARIIDITHDLRPQDITGAAFSILAAYPTFPRGTIHVAVVDPGVGSDRLPIVVQAGNQIFVGPDNGLFSYVCEREAAAQVFAISNHSLFRRPVSSTFHGRDIFAPVAAALSTGLSPAEVGEKLNTWSTLGTLRPQLLGSRTLKGRILHIDHFGNCITNFSREDFPGSQSGVRVSVAGRNIGSFKQYFAEPGPRKAESLFAIWGSAGFLEIAARNRSAAKILRAKPGQAVTAHLRNDR